MPIKNKLRPKKHHKNPSPFWASKCCSRKNTTKIHPTMGGPCIFAPRNQCQGKVQEIHWWSNEERSSPSRSPLHPHSPQTPPRDSQIREPFSTGWAPDQTSYRWGFLITPKKVRWNYPSETDVFFSAIFFGVNLHELTTPFKTDRRGPPCTGFLDKCSRRMWVRIDRIRDICIIHNFRKSASGSMVKGHHFPS